MLTGAKVGDTIICIDALSNDIDNNVLRFDCYVEEILNGSYFIKSRGRILGFNRTYKVEEDGNFKGLLQFKIADKFTVGEEVEIYDTVARKVYATGRIGYFDTSDSTVLIMHSLNSKKVTGWWYGFGNRRFKGGNHDELIFRKLS